MEPPKESQQEPPKESPSVQTLPPKKKKEKASGARTSLPPQPTDPHPVKNVPPSKGTQLTILRRSPPKEETKNDRRGKEKDEISSQSSQETELDVSLEDEKGKKKKGQATLAASPTEVNREDEKEDISGSENELPPLGSSEEYSPTDSTDFLAKFLGDGKEESPSPPTDTAPNDFAEFLKKTGEIKGPLYKWESAKEFPVFSHIDVSEEEMYR